MPHCFHLQIPPCVYLSVISVQMHMKTVGLDQLGKIGSVGYRRMSIGPRTDPCGTSYRIRTVGDIGQTASTESDVLELGSDQPGKRGTRSTPRRSTP